MTETIQIDGSGRLVLPKQVRERLHLVGGSRLRAEVVAGRVELTPVMDDQSLKLVRKGGLLVVKATGASTDAADAVAAEREAQAGRGLRR